MSPVIPSEAQAVLRRVLTREAPRLRAGRPVPLDLEGLVASLGIELVVHEQAAHGLLRNLAGRWQIAVSSSMSRVRQRFTIAHELGHYVVESRLDYRPTSSREYWMLERECQAFAAELLIPTAHIDRVTAGGFSGPSDLIDAVANVAASADVAWEAAARRILERTDEPVMLGVIDITGSNANGILLWLHDSAGSTSLGRGRHIKAREPLAALADIGRRMNAGDRADADLDLGRAVVLRRWEEAVCFAATRTAAQAGSIV